MIVGQKYAIKTKNGIVKKYLSSIYGGLYYFVNSRAAMNPDYSIFNSRGTVYNLTNVIGVAR